MKLRSQWLAGLAAVALALITSATAFGAYSPGVTAAVTITLGRTVTCGGAYTVTATVVDATGTPISDREVHWSFASEPSRADTIKTSSTTTDARGVATTTVVLASVPGSPQLQATADGVSGSVSIRVCAGGVLGVTSGGPGATAGGLPNTSTLPGETPAPQDLPVIGMLLAILAMAAGSGLILRRVSLSRS